MSEANKYPNFKDIIEMDPGYKFFVKHISKWEKYFVMDSYYKGGGGIRWNEETLKDAPQPDLVEIHNDIVIYKCKSANRLISIVKKIINGFSARKRG